MPSLFDLKVHHSNRHDRFVHMCILGSTGDFGPKQWTSQPNKFVGLTSMCDFYTSVQFDSRELECQSRNHLFFFPQVPREGSQRVMGSRCFGTCLWKIDYGALSVYPLLAIIMLAENSEDQSVFHQRCEEQPQCLFCENPRYN